MSLLSLATPRHALAAALSFLLALVLIPAPDLVLLTAGVGLFAALLRRLIQRLPDFEFDRQHVTATLIICGNLVLTGAGFYLAAFGISRLMLWTASNTFAGLLSAAVLTP
jgi:hypothetical protein